MKQTILLTILILISSCQNLEYVDDFTFLSPDKAGNPNFLALINGQICKDMFGEYGNCSLKNRVDKSINIKILPQKYNYEFDFRCGDIDGIKFRKHQDILKDMELNFDIPTSVMTNQKYFNCIGDIIPLDERKNIASNFFEMRIRFFSVDYVEPSAIFTAKYKGKKYLVLGKNAYRSKVRIGKKWYHLKEQTTFKYKTKIDFAVSETKKMRRSYYGKF